MGEYRLERLIASGGHGSVYEAEHRILGRRAAVKVLHPHLADQGEMLQRFVREVRIVNKLRHPNIVDIYDFGLHPGGHPYCVMELLEGQTLSQMLQGRGRMSAERALAYLEPVCEALEAAHRIGVVHRDLKASNVLVVEDGERPRVKLLDFGIAKIIQPESELEGLTVAGQRLGTAHAMAPEQLRSGTIAPYTDIYALGVLLFQMLTGHYPFRSEDHLELERQHLEQPPPRPSATAPVCPSVDAVVLRCLEKEGEQRYPSATAFLDALREAVRPQGPLVLTGRTCQALALHVEVELDPTGRDDEAIHTVLAEVLDSLENELRGAGFLLALQTGPALLGIRLLADEGAVPPEEARRLDECARALYRDTQRIAGEVGAHVYLCAHVGSVEVRGEATEAEILGGPVTDLATWVVRSPHGLHLTPDAARALRSPTSG